jgi:ParB family transcriptional regulator, chromosome partitioning protein
LREIDCDNALIGIIDDIPIQLLKQSPIQLRTTTHQGVDDLAKSIKLKGLLQPILVRACSDDTSQYLEIIAGNRRYEACKQLGWRKVTCHIVEVGEKQAFELLLIENIQRETLNPIEEAKAFKAYILDFGWGGASDLANKLGKSVSYISRRIALLELPTDILDSIANSNLKPTIAQEICALKDVRSQSELAEMITARNLPTKTIQEVIARMNKAGNNCDNLEEVACFYPDISAQRIQRTQKSFNKSIVALRIAMNKLSTIIQDLGDDDWYLAEVLLQHKNRLREEIDLLLREKGKCISIPMYEA